MGDQGAKRRLAAILAADVVGYSRLMEANEDATIAAWRAARADVIDPGIAEFDGRIIKHTGDGFLAEFGAVTDAVRCAVSLQEGLQASSLDFRMGINLGDIVEEMGDIHGDGVNIAARLEGIAEPGGICVSAAVFDQVKSRLDVSFEDIGEQALKNISAPVRAYKTSVKRVAAPAVPVADRPSIAVLPFANMSDSRELEFLADGLAEDIITMLARAHGFFVIARNSTFAYKGTNPDVREVGRDLGVRYAVEGSVRPIGDKLRITVQLIETDAGKHIWADRFERKTDEIYDVLDELTARIVAQIEPELTLAEVKLAAHRAPADFGAWDYYQRAAALLHEKGWQRETFEEAGALLDKAIELDPNFALAHAYQSLITSIGHMVGVDPPEGDAEAMVMRAGELAMNLDSRNSTVLGYVGCALADIGQTGRGIDILIRAVESDPSNSQAWVALGTALLRRGRAREAIEKLRYGMRISPLDNRLGYWGTILAAALLRSGQTEEALKEARLAARRNDNFYLSHIVQAMVYCRQGHRRDAEAAVQEALRIRPDLTGGDIRRFVGKRGVDALVAAGLPA